MNIKPSIDELSRSAKDGCEMCTFILEALENMPTYQLERHIRASRSRDFPIQIVGNLGPGEYYRLLIWFRNPQKRGLYGRTKAFEMCATVPKDPAKFAEYASHIGIRLSHHFLSDTTTKFLRLWLDECVNEHPICNTYRQENTGPPTRLIHVGDALRNPRLVEMSREDRVDYLSLSYCWGKSWNSRTTQANLEKHKVGISMEELSPTIRHAVLLTRHLKRQYLWVDSLCIVQDSTDDWNAESEKMASIYRNSILTIAASRARSSMEGILPDVSERRSPLVIHSETRPVPLYIDSVPRSWNACIEESALSDRAWVLQERLLSCRTLFFSSQQMFWECKTKRASQHQYSNLVEDKEIKQVPESVFNKLPELGSEHRLPLQVGKNDEKPDYLTWYRMTRVYSEKMLTVPSDKLPALAGIAQAFEPRNDIYIAGTWMNDWLGGLLWEPIASRSLEQPRNLDCPRAPSWSWASLDGVIAFPFTSPDHGFSERLRAGMLNIDEADQAILADSKATEANQNISEHNVIEGAKIKEAGANDQSRDKLQVPLPENVGVPNADDEGTIISIQVDEMTQGGLARMTAELLDVGHKTSDFLGKETSIALTIRGHAEWVVGV
ncbi:HET-domain-containing protein, partial [Stipitochalara longipes BDJ]